jgi:hypothetical protein
MMSAQLTRAYTTYRHNERIEALLKTFECARGTRTLNLDGDGGRQRVAHRVERRQRNAPILTPPITDTRTLCHR